jgi:hypothetical protein
MIIFIENSRKFLKVPENQIWVRAHKHTLRDLINLLFFLFRKESKTDGTKRQVP